MSERARVVGLGSVVARDIKAWTGDLEGRDVARGDGRVLYERMIQLDCRRVLRRMVFVTAEARSPEYEPFLRETGMRILAKPFTLQQLREVVARMVGPEILRRSEIHRVWPGR